MESNHPDYNWEQARALAAIHEAGREIAASLDLDRTLRLVMTKAAETLPLDAGVLFVLDEPSQRYRVAVSHNIPPDKIDSITFAFDEGVPGWVVRHCQPLLVDDARLDSRVHPIVVAEGVLSVLAVPLITHGQVMGVLTLFSQTSTHAFNKSTLQLAQVYADQSAVFLENARLVGELRQSAAKLERRVEERTRQLKEKQAQIIQAEKMAAVGRLAASMAHEINNPLQAITLHLQLIADEIQSPESIGQMNVVQQEFNRIAGIVERLLDFQRPQAGEMQPIDILATLGSVLILADKQLERTGVDLVRKLPVDLPMVAAVENQMKQVFLNLILNAAEVMPEGGTLTIAAGHKDDEIHIDFADTGPGLDEETAARIFEPFFTTKSDGSGLGLAISHEIVANHDGTLTVATFPAEVAVLDIRMPGMSGTELLAEIKAGWPHIAVIMLTGHGTLQTAITAVREGAFDYLLKPAKPEAIRDVVARALAEARRQREETALLQALQAGLERLQGLPATPPFSQPNPATSTAILRVGDLIIDRAAYEVRFRGQALALTPAEYKVLVVLAERAGSAVDYITLVRAGLEYDAPAWEAKELIKRHIYTLRQKLEPQPDQPAYILNVRGVGYRLAR